MQPWPDTRDTLLTRLNNPEDRQAWDEFVRIYEPLIYRVATRFGLQDADARDTMQRVLWTVARAADGWRDGNRQGRFRGWLARVTSNAAINLLERDDKHRAAATSSMWDLLNRTPDDNAAITKIWLHERQLQWFRVAAEQVRPSIGDDGWQAFWLTAVEGQPIDLVAQQLNKSLGAVYAVRSRVMAKIRRAVERLEHSETLEECPSQEDSAP